MRWARAWLSPSTLMWYALAAEQNSIANAAAHRDALWNRMTPAAQKQAKEMTATCKSMAFKGCR